MKKVRLRVRHHVTEYNFMSYVGKLEKTSGPR